MPHNRKTQNAGRQKQKSKLVKNFNRAAGSYEESAGLQKETARRLAASLEPWRLILPEGPVLEFGAGTGFLTRELMKLLPEREMTVTDISPEMLEICRQQLSGGADHLTFRVMDAEAFTPEETSYALIAGNFAAQWFKDPAWTLGQFAEALKPGGLLLASFPGNDSFPEWRQQCVELGLPFTGNNLPDTEEMVIKLSMGPGEVDYYEDTRTLTFPGSRDFFRYLREIGADTTLSGKKLTPTQFRLLTRNWDESSNGEITVSWHMVFLVLKRD